MIEIAGGVIAGGIVLYFLVGLLESFFMDRNC